MWLNDTSAIQRRALVAGCFGYGLDGFDFMAYTFVIPTLTIEWNMTRAQAGYIATGALMTSAIGGWLAGILADRYGRVRVLQATVLWFAVFTFLSGFTQSPAQLSWVRALQGFGFGGEWSVGAVLVAESIAARHRGRAVGLVQSSWAVGWAAAALAYWAIFASVRPALAWRILFWLGVLPGLLVVYVRRHVVEPPVFSGLLTRHRHSNEYLGIFRRRLLPTTLLASVLCCGMLSAYYSVTTWLPTYLRSERHLSVADTSTYLLMLIGGSFCGYLASASLSDAWGRRRCFMAFAVGGMLMILAYTRWATTDVETLWLGFPLGFFLSGIFSGTGAFLAELFPTALRGSGQGFCYNIGRAVGAASPALIGHLSTRNSLSLAIGATTAAAYAVVICAAWALPETRGRALDPS
ncbi:MAG: MFS transporter [Pseudomonadota bacterium]|nr:MFS transporter [Pseudomonadota bacterium]